MKVTENLYLHVNEKWLKETKIPEGKSSINAFSEIAIKTEEILTNEIEDMIFNNKEFKLKPLNQFSKLFKISQDIEKREKESTFSINIYIEEILKINNFEDLNNNLIDNLYKTFDYPISFFVYTDMKNSNKHCLYLEPADTFLPEKGYYLDEDKYNENIFKFREYNIEVLREYSLSDSEIHLENAIKFDYLISKYIKTSEERSRYTEMYNESSLEEVKKYSKCINFDKIINHINVEKNFKIIITEPKYFENINNFVNEENFEILKSWILVRFLLSKSDLFTEELRIKGLKFSNYLSGIEKALECKKYYYKKMTSYFSEVIGIHYAEKYFGKESKEDVEKMCKKFIEKYKERLTNNTWLKEETKKMAIKKLDKMELLIGYPEKYKNIYDEFLIDENISMFENIMKIKEIKIKENFSKISKDVNKKEWGMSADTVNAYYSPTNNLICFPAAILQEPFYSINQSKSSNYGGIGAIIAHEISHAFDNNGAKCDENGNINNWWKEEDFKNFEKLTKLMVDQWDGLDMGVGKVNGTLTLSENIADNGGLACSLAVLEDEDNSNFKEFFKNWARIWRGIYKDEYKKMLLELDVHAPAILRANIQVRNFDRFHQTFNTKKGDEMYLEENKRIVIW